MPVVSDRPILSNAQARRIALAAQGFTRPRPSGNVNLGHLRRALSHTQLLQIDSIYVLERAHYVPMYSRLGAYPHRLVDKVAYESPQRRELFEYWGHAASLLPVELYPLLRWRMDDAEKRASKSTRDFVSENRELIKRTYDAVVNGGPLSARQLDGDSSRVRKEWGWNWSDTKSALEWLFSCGHISVSSRPAFERFYDITERVIPSNFYHAPAVERAAATRELVERSAASLGVASEAELRDYFRLTGADTAAAIRSLVDSQVLTPVTVTGWPKPAYLHRDAAVPRRVNARALLSPFDPLIWHRDRAHRLWDFHYRIEIYVPAPKRVHGYYVLPFLLGDELVGRVDLKADRKAGILQVAAAWQEPHVIGRGDIAAELAAELRVVAEWLGLSDIKVAERGDLANQLKAAVAGAN